MYNQEQLLVYVLYCLGSDLMTGKHLGTAARIREKLPSIIQTHCLIYNEMLVVKNLALSLSEVLSLCVKIVNSIKTRQLQFQIFSKLCDELGSEHSSHLLHVEFCWLSRGKILVRVFELRQELSIFLHQLDADLASLVADEI